MRSDTTFQSPYPETILAPASSSGEIDSPSPGDDIGAVDYRGEPSHGQPDYLAGDAADSLVARGNPRQEGGTAVGPMPDKTVQVYDLPDQLSSYDRMGTRGGSQ